MWAMGLRPVYLQGALRRALDWDLVVIEPSSPLTLAPVTPARPAAQPRTASAASTATTAEVPASTSQPTTTAAPNTRTAHTAADQVFTDFADILTVMLGHDHS